jgi:hypothetical protein
MVGVGAVEGHHQPVGAGRIVLARKIKGVWLEGLIEVRAVGLDQGARHPAIGILTGGEGLGVGLGGGELAPHEGPVTVRHHEFFPAAIGVLDQHLDGGEADAATAIIQPGPASARLLDGGQRGGAQALLFGGELGLVGDGGGYCGRRREGDEEED